MAVGNGTSVVSVISVLSLDPCYTGLGLGRDDCHFVKFTTEPKDGMYLGRCFLLDDRTVGELWQQYKVHPRLMCTVQDDDFTEGFRDV